MECGGRIVKIVRTHIRSVWSNLTPHSTLLTPRNIRLSPGTWSTAQITLETQHGPTILPGDGSEGDSAADAVEVHHQQGPPLAALILYDTTLMDVRTGSGILVDLGDTELGAIMANAVLLILRHLRQRCCMVAEGLVSGDGDGLVRSPDALGTAAEGAAIGTVVGGDEIVHPVDLIHVVTLADGTAFRDDSALRLLYRTTHVRLQFRTLHLTIAVDGIDLPVIVEEHTEVVDTALHVMVLPRATDILRGVALQALAVDVGEHIELAVGIADGWCPDTLAVDLLVILQREGLIVEVEAVEAIRDVLPVHEIPGVEYDEARHRVHRRTSEIVVVAHTEDVGVGELVVKERIGISAITIVSRPRLCVC